MSEITVSRVELGALAFRPSLLVTTCCTRQPQLSHVVTPLLTRTDTTRKQKIHAIPKDTRKVLSLGTAKWHQSKVGISRETRRVRRRIIKIFNLKYDITDHFFWIYRNPDSRGKQLDANKKTWHYGIVAGLRGNLPVSMNALNSPYLIYERLARGSRARIRFLLMCSRTRFHRVLCICMHGFPESLAC